MKNLTTIQQTIYLTQQIYAGSALYNVGGYAYLEGELNKRALIWSIEYVLANADVLETGYNAFNNTPSDKNNSFPKVDIADIDFSDRDDPARSCLDWMHTDINETFDFNRSILKVRILKSQDKQYYWYVKVHHLVFDGYSMALFFNKVASLYSTWVSNGEGAINANLYPYLDYVEDEKVYRLSEQFEHDREFWVNRLNNLLESKAFESCYSSAEPESLFSKREEVCIPRDLYDQIDAFCRTCHCTAFHYFIAVLLILNKRYDNETPVIGLPVFNRRNRNFKNTLGTFVNILPFAIRLDGNNTFMEVLSNVKNELKECYKHQRFSLYDVLQELNRKGNIYDITFSYQKNSYDTRLVDMETSITYIHSGEQQENLAFHLLEYSETEDLILAIDYKKELFSGDVIRGLMKHFINLSSSC